jgi:superfamily II DNA/RNA helicase
VKAATAPKDPAAAPPVKRATTPAAKRSASSTAKRAAAPAEKPATASGEKRPAASLEKRPAARRKTASRTAKAVDLPLLSETLNESSNVDAAEHAGLLEAEAQPVLTTGQQHPALATVQPPVAEAAIGQDKPEPDTETPQPEVRDDVPRAATADQTAEATEQPTQPEATVQPEAAVQPHVAESATPAQDRPPVQGELVPQESAQPAIIPIAEGPPPEPARVVFSDLGLSPQVVQAIDDMGYRHPTPIQEQAIPYVLMGRDVMGTAQTGTGKTAGFTLPMLDILSGSRARARMPRSLILEPTRELALQVAENFVQYGKYLKLSHALIIGGESMSDQKDVLNRGVDVLIATPGRLLDMFDRGSILLSDTRILVIDEADRMLDMGFIPDVERIVALLPKTRQTLFFSATMGPEIRRLADAFLQNPKEIAVSRAASVATTITEGLALVAEHDKREALRRLIRSQNVQNALIFCNRKRDVDILYKSLTKHHFVAGALHGDMAQTVRFSTLEKFKANELRLLVCSDVAARGIDIGGLSHVFNFDVPIHAEDYVHRIGRTGRAGLEGKAFTIAAPEDRHAVEQIEKLIGHPIPPVLVEGLDPVDWAEKDARRRRGRNSGDKRKPDNRKTDPRFRPRDQKAKHDRPRGDRPAVGRAAQPEPAVNPDRSTRRDDQRRQDSRRPEPVRSDFRPDEAARSGSRRDETRRAEPRRDDNRRERYRRDDDLGPAVVGFGDDVPAFMFLRTRPPQAMENRESDV